MTDDDHFAAQKTAIFVLEYGVTLTRGMQPDMRCTLLGTEFHVHSVVLKLRPHVFSRFLRSQVVPNNARWDYDYVTCIDPDATWLS